MRGRVATVLAIAAAATALLPTAVAAADQISQNAIGTYTVGWKPGQPAAKWVLGPCV